MSYGLTEKGLRRLFDIANEDKAPTAQKLQELLERRLDNTLFRLAFASSRSTGRQIIGHGHITVNGKNVRTPSILVEKGDIIGFKEGSKAKAKLMKDGKEALLKKDVPAWLSVDGDKVTGTVTTLPSDLEQRFEVSLLVQSFTK